MESKCSQGNLCILLVIEPNYDGYLIENGTVVDPLNKKVEKKDLLVVDGKFEDLDNPPQMEKISARGVYYTRSCLILGAICH